MRSEDGVLTIPQDFDAEQAVLGSILLGGAEAASAAFAVVTVGDFYWSYHKQIAECCFATYQRKEPVDLVTVSAEVRSRGWLQEVGGGEYLTALINEVPTAAHVARYANIVAEKSVLRALIQRAADIQQQASSSPANLGEFLSQSSDSLQQLYRTRVRRGVMQGPTDDFERESRELAADLDSPVGEVSSCCFGIGEVDKYTGGLEEERLVVVKGDTKHGKSQLLRQAALVTARNFRDDGSDRVVILFVLEEGQRAWRRKVTSWLSGIDSMVLLKRGWWKNYAANHPEAERNLNAAESLLPTLPIFRTFTVRDVVQIEATCRAMSYEHKIGLIGIDYFQLVTGGSPDARTEEQALTSRGNRLQALADELACPIICPSQVSYDPNSKRYNTKGARGIEHNASLVLDWRRAEANGVLLDEGHLGCLIARNGPGFGAVKVHTDKRCGHFFDEQEWSLMQATKGSWHDNE